MGVIEFEKWHGTGNDFILIRADDHKEIHFSQDLVRFLCSRHLGIGADGLMLLRPMDDGKVEMKYFNSDGLPSSMCGNGGRCSAAFSLQNEWAEKEVLLEAPDGLHRAWMKENGQMELEMQDTALPHECLSGYFVDTGSPHYVMKVTDLNHIDVLKEGRAWREHSEFAPGGSNVNFWMPKGDEIFMRTYERGVEAETLSCGTGTVAVALVIAQLRQMTKGPLKLQAPGGQLTVDFQLDEKGFTDIRLKGPTTKVFEGKMQLNDQ
jgi:diaminopimelate epimerase